MTALFLLEAYDTSKSYLDLQAKLVYTKASK